MVDLDTERTEHTYDDQASLRVVEYKLPNNCMILCKSVCMRNTTYDYKH